MSALEERARWRGLAFALAAAVATLLAFSLASPAAAQAQGPPAGVVGVNPANNHLFFEPLNGLPSNLYVGANPNPPFVFVLDPLSPLQPGPGCQLANPAFPNLPVCPPRAFENQWDFRLQPSGTNYLQVDVNPFPGVPEDLVISAVGGNSRDEIQFHFLPTNDFVITGLGPDEVNPGPGNDTVNSGAQNDNVNSKDGEVDRVNCAAGKRDVVRPDKKDKVKSCEVRK